MTREMIKEKNKIKQDQEIEAVLKEISVPNLDEYLEEREIYENSWSVRAAKILGINFHLPALAFMEVLSIIFVIIAAMLNIYLIKDSDLLKNHIEGLMILGLTDNFYMNLLFFIPWIFFMALGYNFIKYVPFVKRKENINFFRVVYGFLIILIFIFVWINLFETYGSDVGAAWSMLIFLDLPIIFGILAILVKNRLFIYLSLFAFIFSDLVMYYKNEFEDLLYIILFAALVLLFIEIAESALKFSSVYSNLNTERDRSDYDLLKNTVLKYFIGLISVVGLTVIFAYMIFNSQVIFLMIMPDEIVNSLEFKSPVFLFIPLILFAIFLFFIKWILKYGSSLKILFPASRQGSKKGTIKNE